MPNFNLSSSLSQHQSRSTGSLLRLLVLLSLILLRRLGASFARADAVHQGRLDACWHGPERYLLARCAGQAR